MLNNAEHTKLGLAVLLTVFGCLTLTASFVVPPLGEIHPSVLAAFGEICTFAGVCLGINYNYQFKLKELETKLHKKVSDE